MDRKELVRILSTDLSEGFDTLCPALTIKKLEAYGFGNRSLDLMRSFFDRRFNRVNINGHTSQRKTMAGAVPRVLHLDRFCGICFKMTWRITLMCQPSPCTLTTIRFMQLARLMGL